MPKLIQETCGRATNWTRLGTAEDKDWSEITAQTFLTHQEEKKEKKNVITKTQNCIREGSSTVC